MWIRNIRLEWLLQAKGDRGVKQFSLLEQFGVSYMYTNFQNFPCCIAGPIRSSHVQNNRTDLRHYLPVLSSFQWAIDSKNYLHQPWLYLRHWKLDLSSFLFSDAQAHRIPNQVVEKLPSPHTCIQVTNMICVKYTLCER